MKNLIDQKYLEKRKILYGIPGIYVLTHKGRSFTGLNKRADKIRIDQINHDITTLDVVIHVIKNEHVSMNQIVSEKELHSKDGFGTRKHHPDFIYEKGGESYAVEVELSLKTRERIEENAKLNYLNYDYQIWFIKRENKKIETAVINVLNNLANASIEYIEGD